MEIESNFDSLYDTKPHFETPDIRAPGGTRGGDLEARRPLPTGHWKDPKKDPRRLLIFSFCCM